MAKATAKTLNDFRAAHDRNVIVPNKIRTALDAMQKEGPEHWEYEADFIVRAKISQTDIGLFRDQFEAHIVETDKGKASRGKRIWFASIKVAARARGE